MDTVCTISGVEVHRSQQLIQDSRALMAEVREVLSQARHALAHQRYRKIVCAWCEQTMRWERFEHAVPGAVSHSICFDCFAGVFQELQSGCRSAVGIPLLPGMPL